MPIINDTMESLELPFDLIWEGKPEPLSPADLALANAEDVLIFDKDFANDFGLMNPDFLKSVKCEETEAGAARATGKSSQSALELLLELQQQALAIDCDDCDDDDDCVVYDPDNVVITDLEADQWLTQSMNFFPMEVFGDVAAAANNINHLIGATTNMQPMQQQQQSPAPAAPVKVEQTAQLIREFDSVFEGVELTHLTPPQTPPQSPPRAPQPKQASFIFPSQSNNQQYALATATTTNNNTINNTTTNLVANTNNGNNFFLFAGASPMTMSMSTQDIAHEMEVVEELVRARAENLPDWTAASGDIDDDDDDSNSQASCLLHLMPPSPLSSSSASSSSSSASSSSCPSSAGSSPRSESSYGQHDDIDIDWSAASTGQTSAGAAKVTGSSKQPQRRPRPYGRSTEDKKSRKKEQNKNAATRYRQKKKAEIEVALDEERDLLDVHAGLQVRCSDVQREIKYLKSLMRDLYRVKMQQ